MKKTNRKKKIGIILTVLLFVCAIGIAVFVRQYFHWNLTTEVETFQESPRELQNPNRGYYYIYGFHINDEQMEWETAVQEKLSNDPMAALSLVEVNLQAYRYGEISDTGMKNMDGLFTALKHLDRHYIIRFVYDWEGLNELYEPQSIDIILGHMKQVEPILHKYSDIIFTLQGLFIGNWGEMNGTKYVDEDSLQILASTLASVSDPSTYLSVRTPMQWRKVTRTDDIASLVENGSPYANRLGLFNDGMLGNEGDYGTYGTQSKSEAGLYKEWTRDEELDFQDVLCRTVPIGGEVIMDNEYNDLDNAIADFNRMHVTYLNKDYDWNVLQKWKDNTVHTDDCFDGMDGFSYMKNRLGYRLVLKECRMQQDFWKDTLQIELDIRNVGFAPIYKECEASLIFCPKEEGIMYQMKVEQNLTKLAGGNDTGQMETIQATIPLHNLSKTNYDVYFLLRDKASGKVIYFGNEQDCESNGYKIGQLTQ